MKKPGGIPQIKLKYFCKVICQLFLQIFYFICWMKRKSVNF